MAIWYPDFVCVNKFERFCDVAYIYKITCNVNKKIYIGRSCFPRNRIRQHYNRLKCGKHNSDDLQSDFDLYGEDAFSFTLLCREKGLGKEKEMQKKYKSYLPEYGYNTKDPSWYPRRNHTKKIEEKTKIPVKKWLE